jgi:hypothetical protein
MAELPENHLLNNDNAHHSALGLIGHAVLMITPNILHPQKLATNLRHPIHEVVHTKHRQYPLEGTDNRYVVEHDFFGRLVTLDIVETDSFTQGLIPRVKQLFRPDFYYGHAEYFPQPFKLVNRTYITNQKGNIFNSDEHLNKFK